jgi:hypothetical protein
MVLEQVFKIAGVAITCAVVLSALASAAPTEVPLLETVAGTIGAQAVVIVAGGWALREVLK